MATLVNTLPRSYNGIQQNVTVEVTDKEVIKEYLENGFELVDANGADEGAGKKVIDYKKIMKKSDLAAFALDPENGGIALNQEMTLKLMVEDYETQLEAKKTNTADEGDEITE